MKLPKQIFLYVLECTDGSTYVGITKNLEQCLVKHFNDEVEEVKGKEPRQIRSYIAFNCREKAALMKKFLNSAAGNFVLKRKWL